MDERKTITDYIAQIFGLFGFTMIIMMSFSILVGDDVCGYTTLFVSGTVGVPTAIMAQFLVLSIINVFIRFIFLTDHLIKEMALMLRIILTLLSVLLSSSIFIIIFGWFPVYMWQPWVLFIGSFLLCSAIGIFVTSVQNKKENKRMAEGLANLREQWENENGTEI